MLEVVPAGALAAGAWMLREVSDPSDDGGCDDRTAAPERASADTLCEPAPIAVVDDDHWVSDSLTVALQAHGFRVSAYGSGASFLGAARHDRIACLVIDQHMPGMLGLDVVAALRRCGRCPPAILVTGRLDDTISRRAEELGVLAVLEKPFRVARLVALIRDATGRPG